MSMTSKKRLFCTCFIYLRCMYNIAIILSISNFISMGNIYCIICTYVNFQRAFTLLWMDTRHTSKHGRDPLPSLYTDQGKYLELRMHAVTPKGL